MAVLADQDRADVSMEYQRASTDGFAALTKPDLRAAINALDDFLNTNAAAINTAIPQPARGALTPAQKARLLVFVINKRYVRGS